MAFETTKDVLDHARDFHRQLSDHYAQLRDKAERERVKMLLDYLSRHEKHLDILDNFGNLRSLREKVGDLSWCTEPAANPLPGLLPLFAPLEKG